MAIRPPSGMIAPNDSVYHKRFQVYAVVTIGEQSPPGSNSCRAHRCPIEPTWRHPRRQSAISAPTSRNCSRQSVLRSGTCAARGSPPCKAPKQSANGPWPSCMTTRRSIGLGVQARAPGRGERSARRSCRRLIPYHRVRWALVVCGDPWFAVVVPWCTMSCSGRVRDGHRWDARLLASEVARVAFPGELTFGHCG